MDILFFWIPILTCGLAVVFDLRSREIPNALALGLLAVLPLKLVFADSGPSWWMHIAGGVVALLVASVVGYGDRFGGGDIKLFAALGAWFGLFAIIPLALWTAIAGLPLAVIAALRKQQDFAYAPAIFLGVCVYVLSPDLLYRFVSA